MLQASMIDISNPNVVQTEDICIRAVSRSGRTLKFVDNQTENICIIAVGENGLALKYVHNQTETICMEAVKDNGRALEYVKNQTEAICIQAVKKDGLALEYVKNQTEAICLCAVKQDGLALRFVKNQTPAICIEALDNCSRRKRYYNFGNAYNAIEYPSPQLINQLVQVYPSHTCLIMDSYAQNIMTIYKVCSDAICAHLVQHMNDLLYRPNNVNALVSHKKWHTTSSIAKTVFLMI